MSWYVFFHDILWSRCFLGATRSHMISHDLHLKRRVDFQPALIHWPVFFPAADVEPWGRPSIKGNGVKGWSMVRNLVCWRGEFSALLLRWIFSIDGLERFRCFFPLNGFNKILPACGWKQLQENTFGFPCNQEAIRLEVSSLYSTKTFKLRQADYQSSNSDSNR